MATKTGSKSEPSTMGDLLAQEEASIRGFKRRSEVKGRVVEVTGRTVYVDIGGKAEAVVSEKEYDLARDYFRSLKPGDEVTGIVLVSENDAGQVVISLRRAAVENKWKAFEQALADESVITVKGKEVTRGGLLVEVDGIYGFIPASQFGRELEGNTAAAVGKPIQVRVLEVDRAINRLVLSEKAVSEVEEIEGRRAALEAVEVGGEYEGEVVGMVPFGAFIEISLDKGKTGQPVGEGVRLEGLVHISEISWEKVEDVGKILKVGDKVRVKVIGVDEENGKLALSMKRLTGDPWLVVAQKYKVDSRHRGEVTRVVSYGVLVRLEKGIEGLIHASKLPADRSFKEGDEVEVFVESVDLEKRRLSLGVVAKDTKGMIYK